MTEWHETNPNHFETRVLTYKLTNNLRGIDAKSSENLCFIIQWNLQALQMLSKVIPLVTLVANGWKIPAATLNSIITHSPIIFIQKFDWTKLWYLLSFLWDDKYKRTLAANRKKLHMWRQQVSSLAIWAVLYHMPDTMLSASEA